MTTWCLFNQNLKFNHGITLKNDYYCHYIHISNEKFKNFDVVKEEQYVKPGLKLRKVSKKKLLNLHH